MIFTRRNWKIVKLLREKNQIKGYHVKYLKSAEKMSEKIAMEKVDVSEVIPIGDPAKKIENCLEFCCDKDNCLSLDDILRSFNAPLSEEQAWSLIYQTVLLYRNFIRIEFVEKLTKDKKDLKKSSHRIKVPKSPKNLNIHKDGSVHINDKSKYSCRLFSPQKWRKSITPHISLKQLLASHISYSSYF